MRSDDFPGHTGGFLPTSCCDATCRCVTSPPQLSRSFVDCSIDAPGISEGCCIFRTSCIKFGWTLLRLSVVVPIESRPLICIECAKRQRTRPRTLGGVEMAQ